MKTFITTLFLMAGILTSRLNAQASFTLVTSLCSGNTVSVTANSGTLSAMAYSWAASPSGPVFSASSSASTTINFPAAGTYTIGLGILSGSGFSYATNTIVVNITPTVSVAASSTSICPGESATLTASGAGSYSWVSTAPLSTTTGSVIVVSPTVATAYNVTGTLGACTASFTQVLFVTPLPGNGSITVVSVFHSVCAGFTSTVTAFGANSYTWMGTGIISPVFQQSLVATPGTYTVSGHSNGCYLTNTVTIGLKSPITIGVTQTSPTTCITNNFPKFSKPAQLIASGANTFVWFPYTGTPNTGPTFDVRPAATTCYTVIGSTQICSASAIVCVTVIPQFTIEVAPPSVMMCVGDTHSLSVVNFGSPATGPASAFTYIWTEALNAPPISISGYFTPTVNIFPQNSTSYTVETRDANNCISVPNLIAVNVNACTGLTRIEENNSTLFYPNPVNSNLYIRSNRTGDATLRVTDVLGKILLSEQIWLTKEKELSLDLSTLKPGVYNLCMLDLKGGTLLVRRIFKE